MMDKHTWERAQEILRKQVGPDAYKNWIEPLTAEGVSGGIAKLRAPTSFIGKWVAKNFGDMILAALAQCDVDVKRLDFTTGKATSRPGSTLHATRASAQVNVVPTGFKDLPGAALDPRLTFENFVVGKPNEMAHAAARRVAEEASANFNPLFLYGGVGLGKTHLMQAIAWEISERDPEAKVLYLSAEQFMYRFVQALRFKDTISFKEMFRSVDLLIVDDVQFIAGKDSTQEEFFHTFNALVDQNKRIIISGDKAPGEIENLDERIASRLQWGLVVDIHPTNYELRLGILQSKAEAQSELYPGVTFADGVLEFIAHRISSNVRVLEGALTRLFAFGSLVGREVTLEMAHESLSDILRASDKKVTIDEIMRRVSDHYHVKITDLMGPRRTRSIARPRQVAMYLAKKLTHKSLPDIGNRIGGRDHTTVIHAVKRIEELQAVDSQIREDLELLRRLLEA